MVAELAGRWDLQLGATFSGGTASYVAEAHDGAGRPCVLKVAMPLDIHDVDTFSRSVRVHGLAAGRGCAQLLAHDDAVPAMLVERLGPNLADLGLELPELLDAVARTLREFWRPVPAGFDLPTGAVAVTSDRPLDEEQVRAAVEEAGYELVG